MRALLDLLVFPALHHAAERHQARRWIGHFNTDEGPAHCWCLYADRWRLQREREVFLTGEYRVHLDPRLLFDPLGNLPARLVAYRITLLVHLPMDLLPAHPSGHQSVHRDGWAWSHLAYFHLHAVFAKGVGDRIGGVSKLILRNGVFGRGLEDIRTRHLPRTD